MPEMSTKVISNLYLIDTKHHFHFNWLTFPSVSFCSIFLASSVFNSFFTTTECTRLSSIECTPCSGLLLTYTMRHIYANFQHVKDFPITFWQEMPKEKTYTKVIQDKKGQRRLQNTKTFQEICVNCQLDNMPTCSRKKRVLPFAHFPCRPQK